MCYRAKKSCKLEVFTHMTAIVSYGDHGEEKDLVLMCLFIISNCLVMDMMNYIRLQVYPH